MLGTIRVAVPVVSCQLWGACSRPDGSAQGGPLTQSAQSPTAGYHRNNGRKMQSCQKETWLPVQDVDVDRQCRIQVGAWHTEEREELVVCSSLFIYSSSGHVMALSAPCHTQPVNYPMYCCHASLSHTHRGDQVLSGTVRGVRDLGVGGVLSPIIQILISLLARATINTGNKTKPSSFSGEVWQTLRRKCVCACRHTSLSCVSQCCVYVQLQSISWTALSGCQETPNIQHDNTVGALHKWSHSCWGSK